jgi:hypothetical protein
LLSRSGEIEGIDMFGREQRKRPAKGGYISEFEQYMEAFMDEHPEVVEDQRKGWYIFWDTNVDFDALEKAKKDRVPTPGGYYYPD